MKGFKNSTKMMSGHHHAIGGAVGGPMPADIGPKPLEVGGMKSPQMNVLPNTRPIMPRPHIMPQVKMAGMKAPPLKMGSKLGGVGGLTRLPRPKFAKGGQYHDGGGGPYLSPEGNALEHRQHKPYSKTLQEHPDDKVLRPGYKKGGMHIKPGNKGKFTKRMTGSKKGHLTDKLVSKGLHSSSGEVRKEANFARMARRHFKPLHKGGKVDADCYAEGGSVRKIAKQEVAKHVATPKPRGHGIKGGNLAFMSKPLIGE